jgi:hypothetical protein
LRAGGERPSCRSAAEKRDELAASHHEEFPTRLRAGCNAKDLFSFGVGRFDDGPPFLDLGLVECEDAARSSGPLSKASEHGSTPTANQGSSRVGG